MKGLLKYIMKEKYISLIDNTYYRVRIRKDGVNFSQVITISDYFSQKQALNAAIMIRDKALADIHANVAMQKTPTVGYLFEKTYDLFGYSAKTWSKHVYIFNNAIAPYSNKQITEIKTADIMETVVKYVQTHSDDATNRLISVWHSIYQAAQMLDIPVIDHTQAVKMATPKSKIPSRQPTQGITNDEIETFFKALEKYNHVSPDGRKVSTMVAMIARIMMYTGCRPAEAMALTRDDIDFVNDQISINKSIGSTHEAVNATIRSTKTKQSVREIPMAAELKPLLQEYMKAIHPKQKMLFMMNGKPLEISFLSNYVHNVSKSAGIHVTLYMFRHKFSTDLIKVTDLRTVQDLMGHESGEMTLQYARSTEADRKQAIDHRKL